MSLVLLPNEFDLHNLSFSEPKKNSMGGTTIVISYTKDGKTQPLNIQTPRLRSPFGYDAQQPEGSQVVKYAVNLTVNNSDNINKFLETIKAIENLVKEKAAENSEQWFGKKKSIDDIDLNSVIKYPKNEKYDPTIKVKFTYSTKEARFALEDENKNPINVWDDSKKTLDLTAISKGCHLLSIIQCTGVYIIRKKEIGIGFRILKARVYCEPTFQNLTIIDDEEDEGGEPYQEYEED